VNERLAPRRADDARRRGSCFVLDAREKLRRLASRLIKLDQDIPRSGAALATRAHARQPPETGFDLNAPWPSNRAHGHARAHCTGARTRAASVVGLIFAAAGYGRLGGFSDFASAQMSRAPRAPRAKRASEKQCARSLYCSTSCSAARSGPRIRLHSRPSTLRPGGRAQRRYPARSDRLRSRGRTSGAGREQRQDAEWSARASRAPSWRRSTREHADASARRTRRPRRLIVRCR